MKYFHRKIIVQKFNQYISQNIKDRSNNILKLWQKQCEYIVAQRFRRSQQMVALYTRLWDEHALRILLQRLQKLVSYYFNA